MKYTIIFEIVKFFQKKNCVIRTDVDVDFRISTNRPTEFIMTL